MQHIMKFVVLLYGLSAIVVACLLLTIIGLLSRPAFFMLLGLAVTLFFIVWIKIGLVKQEGMIQLLSMDTSSSVPLEPKADRIEPADEILSPDKAREWLDAFLVEQQGSASEDTSVSVRQPAGLDI